MEQRTYFPALDGLRAIAVLCVFFHHYTASLLPAGLRFGWAGVDVFFALSGFLITGILFDTRTAHSRWHDFYLRRTLRIFPLFYGILLLLVLTTPIVHWNWTWRWLSLPGYFFNFMPPKVPNHAEPLGLLTGWIHHRTAVNLVFFHFWTLCVEEQFYLIWPAVVFFIKDRRRLLQIIAVLIPLVLVLRCVIFFSLANRADASFLIVRATYGRADSLMAGAALALLLRGPEAKRVLTFGGRLLTMSLALFCALDVASVMVLHEPFGAEQETPWIMLGGFTCLAIGSAALVLLCLQGGNKPLTRALCWQPMRWLGQRSYGFYVFHMIWVQPTLVLAKKLLGRQVSESNPVSVILLQTAIAFCVTLGFSAASYKWFERPFLKLKDRWTHRPQSAMEVELSQKHVIV